jgi:hypothetical protein
MNSYTREGSCAYGRFPNRDRGHAAPAIEDRHESFSDARALPILARTAWPRSPSLTGAPNNSRIATPVLGVCPSIEGILLAKDERVGFHLAA